MMHEFIDFVDEVYPSLAYDTKKKAKMAIRDFEEMNCPNVFLMQDTLEELSQGDILSEIPFCYFDGEGQQNTFKAKAMVLSMSCDIENNDMILLAPVLRLSDYASDDVSGIVHNTALTYLYYPDEKLKDYYIDFSYAFTYSSSFIRGLLNDGKLSKIASLNQVGYYMFLCKLSVFFTRREDPQTQQNRKK